MRRLLLVLVLTGSVASALEFPILAEGQWQLSGRVSATACARGRCVTQRQGVNQSFEVTADGGGGDALVIPTCPQVTLPDDASLFTLEPGRNGWLRVRVLDRRALVRLLRECTGYPTLRLQRLSARVRVEPSGQAFEVREKASFTVVVRGIFVQAFAAAHLYGLHTTALDGSARAQAAPEDAVGSALVRAITAAIAR
jgi:hypothetical protein